MTVLKGYTQVNTHQIDPINGCVPWSMEWLILYKGIIKGIWEIPRSRLELFQYQFNLQEQTDMQVHNTFINVFELVREFYPKVRFYFHRGYRKSQAQQKYQRIEQLIGQGYPCAITIKLLPQHDAHIVPVVEFRQNDVKVIWDITPSGQQNYRFIPYNDLYQMHNAGRAMNFMFLL